MRSSIPLKILALRRFQTLHAKGSCHRGLSIGSESGVEQVINPPSTIGVGEEITDLPSFVAPDWEVVNIFHLGAKGADSRGSKLVVCLLRASPAV
jgi:hypothetical protein